MAITQLRMKNNIQKFLKEFDKLLSAGDTGIIFLNIDNLPMLVLAHGHEKAEEILTQLTAKLGGNRLMSDQIFLISHADKQHDPKKNVQQVKELLNASEIHIASTITYKTCRHGNDAAEELSNIYSQSMGENNVFSVSNGSDLKQHIDDSKLHMEVAKQIKSAMKADKFRLAYQPIIEAKSGNISHHEALLRIVGDDGKLRSAGSFIPIAEKTGLIDSIDVKVLEMVVDELRQNPERRLAFNISNLTIGNREWIKRFFEIITPDIGKHMIIEITETSILRDLKETAYFIATLQDAGCMFALDDFGSGYTSFRQIRSLSFDYIKIDGSLVSDIAINPHNRLLVKSLLEYMKGLNIKTVAEFVENGEIAKILMEFGIDYMQGNYFGKAA